MIRARCFKCGHAFQLTEQFVANALAAEGVSGKPSHYVAECPQCRQAIKISLKRVRLPEPEIQGEAGTEEQGTEE
jgi:Zn ribbon nucleic-acid-binding protein